MKLFAIEIPLVATAYIKADSAEQALNIANAELTETGIEFSARCQSLTEAICMDGRPYECLEDNDEDIALSPAMSLNQTGYSIDDVEEVEL